jgi:hypothetical protein
MTKNGKEEIVLLNNQKSAKKKKTKAKIQKAIGKIPVIAKLNTYLHALLDPFGIHGVQVPDFSCEESACFYSVYRNVLTVGTGGCTGAIFGIASSGTYPTLTPFGGLVPYNTGTADAYSVGMILAQNMAAANMIVNTPTNIKLTNFNSGTASIPTNFSRVRLASFGVRISYIGNLLQSQGKITVAYAPTGTLTNKIANATLALSDILQLPKSQVVSVPLVGNAAVMWRPTDFLDQNYCQVGASAPAILPSSTFLPSGCAPCEIYVFVDGAVSTQTFFVEAVFNYEAIPTNNTLSFVNTAVSRSDPISLAHAATTIQSMPATIALPNMKNEEIAKSESITTSHPPSESPNLMDTLLEYAPKVFNGAKKAYETFSPMVETLLSAL